MAKGLTTLADMRRQEHYKNLMSMDDRDMCEMIRAHFESHPAMPGEKAVKDQVNYVLNQLEDNERAEAEKAEAQRQANEQYAAENDGFIPAVNTPFDEEELARDEFEPVTETPFDKEDGPLLGAGEKEQLAWAYAKTRIRETPLAEGNYYLDYNHFDPTALKRDRVDELPQENNADIIVERVNVELQKNGAGEVTVMADRSDGGLMMIGHLPGNFLTNNPMNVDSCGAELQIADFSNGNMKNISARIVVDTDIMSGDVIDLDDDLINGLNQDDGLKQ